MVREILRQKKVANCTIAFAYIRRTLNFADMKGWNDAESEGWKVADTIFSRDGMWPTPISNSRKYADTFF